MARRCLAAECSSFHLLPGDCSKATALEVGSSLPRFAYSTCLLDFRHRVTPETGSSITSTTAVSIAGATGFFIPGTAFFAAARLGLAFATIRLAAFTRRDLRAFPRLAEFPLGSFPRFCTFDFFLRLGMIGPGCLFLVDQKTTSQVRQPM